MNTTPPDFDTTRSRVLGKNAPALGLVDIKDFFCFYVACSCGRITTNGKLTAESMVSRAEDFYCAFTLETGTKTEESQYIEIYKVSSSLILILSLTPHSGLDACLQ